MLSPGHREDWKMIKDRLKELKDFQSNNLNEYQESFSIYRDDLAQNIHLFLEEVEAIHDMLTNIRVNTAEIKTLFNIILTMPGAHEKKNSEVAERQSIVRNTICNIKSKLQNLEIFVKNTGNNVETLHRIHTIQLYSLHEILRRLVEEYNCTLLSYKARCMSILKRQVAIIILKCTEKCITLTGNHEGELDDLLERGVSVFADNIIADTLQAQILLNIVSCRNEELKKIESSLQDMREMFVQLSIHIENQGEKMNCIRYLVEKSELYADHSAAKLEKSHKKTRRKRQRCRKIKFGIALSAILFGFILLVIIST